MAAKFSEHDAKTLIRMAIEHGAIKFKGAEPAGNADIAQKCAEIDAKYLLTLINELQKEPT